MDLQSFFYVFGIIVMILWILIFITLLTILLSLKRHVDRFKQSFRDKIAGIIKGKEVGIASAMGLTVAHLVLDKIKRSKDQKKEQEKN